MPDRLAITSINNNAGFSQSQSWYTATRKGQLMYYVFAVYPTSQCHCINTTSKPYPDLAFSEQ
jgi:hypothetical protein